MLVRFNEAKIPFEGCNCTLTRAWVDTGSEREVTFELVEGRGSIEASFWGSGSNQNRVVVEVILDSVDVDDGTEVTLLA